jgi:tetratricopeptide (TPR) repeat protein
MDYYEIIKHPLLGASTRIWTLTHLDAHLQSSHTLIEELTMDNFVDTISAYEQEIESALESYEQNEKLGEALRVYQIVESKLLDLDLPPAHRAYPRLQAVLAYCLLREGNIVRQSGQPQEAMQLSAREITAARNSGDDITIARSLMSYGTTLIGQGNMDGGMPYIEEARHHFESGDSYDHRQGLGWYWILRADIANAGLQEIDPTEVLVFADNAIAILGPIENWPGVSRAYAARAVAHESLGDLAESDADRVNQDTYSQR